MTAPKINVLNEMFHRAWWVVLLRSILALLLGLLAFFWPAATIVALVQLLGLFFLLDAVLLIIGAIAGFTGISRWLSLLGGIFCALAGIAIFSQPSISTLAMGAFVIYLVAAFILIAGILRLFTVIRLWKTSRHKWLLLVESIVAIVFAVVLIESPIVSAVVLMRIVGIFAVVMAVSMIILALGLRKLARAASPGGVSG